MPVGGRDGYEFRGEKPHGEGTLEDALVDILTMWMQAPSLREHHHVGVLEITITLAGVSQVIEVTDRAVLEAFRNVGPVVVLDHLAGLLGMDRKDAMMLLEEARVEATATRLQVPSEPEAWRPDPDKVPVDVLATVSPDFLAAQLKEADEAARRARGRPRSLRGRHLLDVIVRMGKVRGWSDIEIAKRTHLPRETVRDARHRIERTELLQVELGERPAGRPLTPVQRQVVLERVEALRGNASAAARQLGLPARTVREIRQRAAQEAARRVGLPGLPEAVPRARTAWKDTDRDRLFKRMRRTGRSASEVARDLGIPDRTARRWVRSKKIEMLED